MLGRLGLSSLPLAQHVLKLDLLAWKNRIGVLNAAVCRQGLRPSELFRRAELDALALGLVTAAPDDIDWADEIRIAVEERAAMSPDSSTGLEANLRFCQKESMETRIFGRLSAWQNWIFNRPNAVGEKGALKVYGKGEKVQFDMNRV